MTVLEPRERPDVTNVEEARTFIAPRRSRFWWLYAAVTLVTAAAVFLTAGVINYRLNPLIYNSKAIREVAADLDAGLNYANYDPNINWRALRREEIRQWTKTPDVILFGGSRWWEAHADLVPGHTFANLWVSNDQAEDALALTYLLEKAHRLPKTLILSLRFISFQPPTQRDAAEWQEWAPEYRAMAKELGLRPHSYLATAPIKATSARFYAPSIYSRLQQRSKVHDRPHVTTQLQQPQLETYAADGSIYWSRATLAKFTKAYVDKAVKGELNRDRGGMAAPHIDSSLITAFEKVVQRLRGDGVRVVLAQTAYHPTFWNTVRNLPFGKLLVRLEGIATAMAQRGEVVSVGSYDPAVIGCAASDFIDALHSHSSCIGKVLHLIPGLTTGPPR